MPPATSLARVAIASLPTVLGAGEHTVQFGIFVCEGQHLVACLQNRLPVHMNQAAAAVDDADPHRVANGEIADRAAVGGRSGGDK